MKRLTGAKLDLAMDLTLSGSPVSSVLALVEDTLAYTAEVRPEFAQRAQKTNDDFFDWLVFDAGKSADNWVQSKRGKRLDTGKAWLKEAVTDGFKMPR